jgi:predicted GIY-YIG superfamily endonuclease
MQMTPTPKRDPTCKPMISCPPATGCRASRPHPDGWRTSWAYSVEERHPKGIILGVDAQQLRLFLAPKPLVERLGVEFFRRVPTAPGVYLMAGERERLLYVGKAQNLRQRLNSYRHIQPERASRKVVRLIHEVRSVTWEICSCAASALLRENELLRLHKPKFNVMNARPEHYLFIGVRAEPESIHLRLTNQPVRLPGEKLHGAFKGLGRVRAGFAALLRLLWATEHQPPSIFAYPMALVAESCPETFSVRMTKMEPEHMADLLHRLLDGVDDELILRFMNAVPVSEGDSLCQQRLHELDLDAVKHFYEFGPARNRSLRERCALDGEVIAQAELDDLLVLASVGEDADVSDSTAAFDVSRIIKT